MSAGRPPQRRLFFALWPDAAQRDALLAGYRDLLARAGGRAVAGANLHVTLEFLGAVPEARLAELAPLGAGLGLPAVVLQLDAIEWWRTPQALVALASAPPAALLAAQQQLRQRLNERGFRVDSRPYRPHVTLMRKVATAPPAGVVAPVEWRATEVALVESASAQGGSRYVPLERWPCVPG